MRSTTTKETDPVAAVTEALVVLGRLEGRTPAQVEKRLHISEKTPIRHRIEQTYSALRQHRQAALRRGADPDAAMETAYRNIKTARFAEISTRVR